MGKARIGFDFGAGAVKIAQCDNSGNARRLAVETIPDHLIRGGLIVSYEAMSEFLRETRRKYRIKKGACAVVLPAEAAFLRRLSLPVMTAEQLKVNLPYEFRDYLTDSKDKYFYDYAVNEVRRGEDGEPTELDLTAAAVPKETIVSYTAMFRRAGFKLVSAAPSECAYANIIRLWEATHPEGVGREYCIMDLGHAATRIHMFTGSRFEVTRVIEYGSATVDSAIADALGVDEHIARAYKEADHNGAQSLEGPKSVYNSIAVEMMKAINFYGFNNRESNLEDAYFCGGGGEIVPLVEAIEATVSLKLHGVEELMTPFRGRGKGVLPFCAAAVGMTQQ